MQIIISITIKIIKAKAYFLLDITSKILICDFVYFNWKNFLMLKVKL